MSILGILIIYIKIFTGNIIKFKGRKDYTSIFKSDIIIIKNIGEKKMIILAIPITKIIKKLKFPNLISIMVNRRSLNLNSFNLLYNFGIIILLLKKENKLFILLI